MGNVREVVDRHVAAFGAKDADAEPWSVDAEMINPVGRFRGREGVLGFLKVYWDAFPDARIEITGWIEDDERAAAEGLMIGTHTGVLQTPAGEIPPTGRGVEIRWAAMYEASGGELVSEHLYLDQLDFMTQLGIASSGAEEPARG